MADVSLCVSMVARSVMKRRRYWPCHRLRRVCHACSRDRCQQQCLSWKIHGIFTFVSTSFCCIENVGGESLVCYALTFFRFSSSFFRQPLLFVIVHFHFVWITALDQKICSYTLGRNAGAAPQIIAITDFPSHSSQILGRAGEKMCIPMNK